MLSQRLKELRNRKKRTQQDVAKYLGLTRPAYTAYESGNRNPDYETLVKIADYFDVTTDYLLGRDVAHKEVSQESLFPSDQLGIDQKDYDSLTAYQQEALDWAANNDYLQFKNKSDDIMDMIERIEIAYEVDKVMKKRKKNNK
ncbi:helix-turn-helix domain-containing protein [Planococcus sp. SSTMD024]|uniref:helix-turn-helix domain-containing protein n=1 Tax=Planococcus sp. SSTMD024 TaxID=3242163 RepID=UPI00351DA9AD